MVFIFFSPLLMYLKLVRISLNCSAIMLRLLKCTIGEGLCRSKDNSPITGALVVYFYFFFILNFIIKKV